MKTRLAIAFVATVTAFAQPAPLYEPITKSERWKEFAKANFTSPGAYFSAFGPAIGAQINNDPPEWGQGVKGYAHRAGYYYGRSFIDSSIRHSSAAAFGHDVRYERSTKKGFLPRTGHAISRGFVTRNNDGKLVPFISNFMGSYGGGMLSTYMLPDRYDPLKRGLQQGHVLFAANTGGNILREFAPEIKKLFRRR